MNTNTPGTPQPPNPVHALVTATQVAHDDNAAAKSRWPQARLVMWLSAAAALATDGIGLHGLTAWIPAVLPLPGLAFTGACILRMQRTEAAEEQAWKSLRAYTGLSDEALALLVEAFHKQGTNAAKAGMGEGADQ